MQDAEWWIDDPKNWKSQLRRSVQFCGQRGSDIKDSALEKLVTYVRNKITAENKPELAPFLLDLYKQHYPAEGGNENDLAAYNVQNMCRILQSRIPLNIEATNNKTVVWKKENMKYDEALRLAKVNAESDDRVIWRCKIKLRNDIVAVQICESVTVDNIMDGEAIPPDSFKSYFKMFYTGNLSTTEKLSSRRSRLIAVPRVNSSQEDIYL